MQSSLAGGSLLTHRDSPRSGSRLRAGANNQMIVGTGLAVPGPMDQAGGNSIVAQLGYRKFYAASQTLNMLPCQMCVAGHAVFWDGA